MHQEQQYLDIMKDILKNGKEHKNRTEESTLRLKNKTMSFDLTKGFPLLTTKKMFFKGIVTELLWFLKGDTNIKYLNENGNHIWDKNQLDFHNKRKAKGIETEKGDCGYIYGKQWRDFNGIDQIKDLVHNLKNNPNSRRHIVSAWNPKDIHPYISCLPPCHVMFQCFVEGNKLSLTLYQRSGDFFLGVPFNIASYSLLTHLLAKSCNLKAKEFFHIIGDCHIYKNHINQCKEQISRNILDMPKLLINENKKDLFAFEVDDFKIINYNPHLPIKADMAI